MVLHDIQVAVSMLELKKDDISVISVGLHMQRFLYKLFVSGDSRPFSSKW